MEFEEVESAGIWLPEKENDELIGEVMDITDGDYGIQATIKREDGMEVRTPSHKVLQSRMARVKKGDIVRIVFVGEESPKLKGHSPMKQYKFYIGK